MLLRRQAGFKVSLFLTLFSLRVAWRLTSIGNHPKIRVYKDISTPFKKDTGCSCKLAKQAYLDFTLEKLILT